VFIKFLDVNKFVSNLTPITSTEFFTRGGDFNPEGLFSESIFGVVGSIDRTKKYSYIDINIEVIHPSAYKILYRLDRRIEKFISTEENFSLDKDGTLKIDPDGVTGLSNFIDIFPNIKFRGETKTRENFIELLQRSYKDKTLFVSKVPVIPPDFRPIFQDESGNWTSDELNEIYLSILRKSFQIKTVSKSGPLFDLLSYGVQQAVINHDAFIQNRIQKKSGLIRSDLMGKRVDFSGRGVIVPGPNLKVNEIGIPFRMATTLFEPFLIHRLLYSGKINESNLEDEIKNFDNVSLSVDSVQRVIKAIRNKDVIPDELYKIFFDATESVMEGRVVLAKRDPVLHAESYRAYYPRLIEGDTIQVCTLQVGQHNADFDGDVMAIYHPLTNEAQQEAKEKMMKGTTGTSSTDVSFDLSKEMAVGLYIITKNVLINKSPIIVNEEDLENATNPYIPVKFRGKNTTMGKAILNNAFPPDFEFIDKTVTKKIINSYINTILEKYGENIAIDVFSKLEKIGFKFATISAPSIKIDDIELPDEIYEIKKQINGATVEQASILINKAKQILIKHLKNTGLYDLVESGAAKGWDQPTQILIAKGIIADPTGKVLDPISGSYSDGLTNKEFFEMSQGGRKGMIDRALNTSTTGYLSRKLVYLLSNVEADPYLKDCGTKKYLNVRLDKDLIKRLKGRYFLNKGRIEEFIPEEHKVGETIQLRSPIFCKSYKICHTCYGKLLLRHKSPYIGTIAGMAIGERGTQLIMRTFHLGGAVSITDKNLLKDILENDPLLDINENKLNEYIQQEENGLICKKDCILKLDLNVYNMNNNIRIEDNSIWVSNLISTIEFDNLIFNIVLDYSVIIQKRNFEEINKQIVLNYKQGDIILETSLETSELKDQANYMERLIGGRELFKDTTNLFKKITNKWPSGDMDSVHIEVLMSNVLRNKDDINIPARLGKTWDPVLINIKEVIFNSSFVSGLAFENIGKAIQTGLTSEDKFEPSILDRILSGTF